MPTNATSHEVAAPQAGATPIASSSPGVRLAPRKLVAGVAIYLLVALGGIVLLRTAVFEAFEIDGPSMEPTLYGGDRVVVDKAAFGLWLPGADAATHSWASPLQGDVVIAKSPFDDVDIVKRVVAVGGQTVAWTDGQLVVDSVPASLDEIGACLGNGHTSSSCRRYVETVGSHRWVIAQSPFMAPAERSPVRIPPGHVYLLGDRRDHSNDSRNPMIGPVPVARIKGRAFFLYFSHMASRIGSSVL